MSNVLEVKGLNKHYNHFSLSDVDFTLPEGCITGFIGVNGAGKTTTLRTILGLTQKSSGSIRLFGKDMEQNEQELKNRIGIVLDDGYFYDELTMDEMKSIIAPAYTGWSNKDYKNHMERFSLNPRQKIATLSKGMRMKFALTLALSHQADLLIMDEPTSGLDPLVRSQLLDTMKDYMQQGGKGVFFSTHITSDLDKVADVLILIHEGKIIFQEEKDRLLDKYRLVKGDVKALNEKNQKLFYTIEKTNFAFTGVTDRLSEVQKEMTDLIIERPSIEDIMLAHLEGGRTC